MPDNELMAQALGASQGGQEGAGSGLTNWLAARHAKDIGQPSMLDVLMGLQLLGSGPKPKPNYQTMQKQFMQGQPALKFGPPGSAPAYAGRGQLAQQGMPDETEKVIAQIAKFLEANPGGSIADFAGPSSVYTTKSKFTGAPIVKIDPSTLPRDAQWYLPQRAADAGFNVASHHGTDASVDFNKFRLPRDEIGVHFGSPRAAQAIMGNQLDGSGGPQRIYPVALQAKNPLQVPDMGNWYSKEMAEALMDRRDMFPPGAVGEAYAKGIPGFRDLLSKSGYDSLKYLNKVEDPGHMSYILFKESQKHPGFVAGARSPWAAYKDLSSADLLAGLGGAGVLLGAAGDQGRD